MNIRLATNDHKCDSDKCIYFIVFSRVFLGISPRGDQLRTTIPEAVWEPVNVLPPNRTPLRNKC